MVASQNMVQTLLGTDNSTKGKKVETAIHHAKQPQLSVNVSMIESLNEEIEIKLWRDPGQQPVILCKHQSNDSLLQIHALQHL